MSRGMGPLVPILIGIVVIFVVVFGVLASGRSNLSKILGFGDDLTEKDGVIPGTKVGSGLPVFRLSGSKAQMKEQLVNLLLSCWKSHDEDEHDCYIVEFDLPGDAVGERVPTEAKSLGVGGNNVLTREELTAELQGPRSQPDAAAAFDSQSTWQKVRHHSMILLGYVSGGKVIVPRYKICVDDDSPASDELFMADTVAARCE